MLGGFIDLAQTVEHARLIRQMLQRDLRHTDNTVHRRPDVVRHIAQEQALRLIRSFCRLISLL